MILGYMSWHIWPHEDVTNRFESDMSATEQSIVTFTGFLLDHLLFKTSSFVVIFDCLNTQDN